MKKYKLGSLFAGIGGIDLGLKFSGFDPIWANEIDEFCALTFKENHTNTELIIDDIRNIDVNNIPEIDIIAGGFPCQPFSVAGNRKGFDDDRGDLFFQIIKILKEMKTLNRMPKIVLLENVKNLFTHSSGKTYQHMKDELKKLGYTVTENILNTADYGNIPQNRERLYIIGFLDKNTAKKFSWPKPIPLDKTIDKVIDWNKTIDSKYYYTPKNKCFELLEKNITEVDTIYQYRRVYVRKNQSRLCPTLTANMGMGGHNVPLIIDKHNRIRKLTPKECLNLQGFPEDFIIPKNLSDSRAYKQAGNSVSVKVIERIGNNILKALEKSEVL